MLGERTFPEILKTQDQGKGLRVVVWFQRTEPSCLQHRLFRRMVDQLPLKQKTELALLERSSSPAVLIGAHASLQDVFIVAQALGNGHGDKFS